MSQHNSQSTSAADDLVFTEFYRGAILQETISDTSPPRNVVKIHAHTAQHVNQHNIRTMTVAIHNNDNNIDTRILRRAAMGWLKERYNPMIGDNIVVNDDWASEIGGHIIDFEIRHLDEIVDDETVNINNIVMNDEEWAECRRKESTLCIKALSKADPLRMPKQYEEPLIEYVASAIQSELQRLTRKIELPNQAPELYSERSDKSEDIAQFLQRVWYDPYIKAGVLTRRELRRLDESSDMALRNWTRDPPPGSSRLKNKLPDHLHIPTKSEVVTKWVEGRSPAEIREARRLSRAHERAKSGR